MSTIKVDAVKSSVAGIAPVIRDLNGVEVSQGCTAWVNFNGTGVVAIRDSFNVSGITDNGIGDYMVNFATPMTKVNWVLSGSATDPLSNSRLVVISESFVGALIPRTVNGCRVMTGWAGASASTGFLIDSAMINAVIFGGK